MHNMSRLPCLGATGFSRTVCISAALLQCRPASHSASFSSANARETTRDKSAVHAASTTLFGPGGALAASVFAAAVYLVCIKLCLCSLTLGSSVEPSYSTKDFLQSRLMQGSPTGREALAEGVENKSSGKVASVILGSQQPVYCSDVLCEPANAKRLMHSVAGTFSSSSCVGQAASFALCCRCSRTIHRHCHNANPP